MIKTVVRFLMGLIMLVSAFLMLYFSGVLYNLSDQLRIDGIVFQPNNLSYDRIGKPLSLEEVSDKFLRERLIKKFVTEYFYVIPDIRNTEARTKAGSSLYYMAVPKVFNNWKESEANLIRDMTNKKMLVKVNVTNMILPEDGEYWNIYYDKIIWEAPNNMAVEPIVESGVLYLKISFKKAVWKFDGSNTFDVAKFLRKGGNPVAIFNFKVLDLKR